MLNFTPSTILWTVVNLLVLFALLRIFLFKPVNKMMDDRAKAIEDSISGADGLKAEAEQIKADYEQKLAQARTEAAEIVARARERGEREYEAILQSAEADAQKLRENTRDQLAAEREAMIQGARKEVAALALLAAAKVSGKAMDADADRALVNAFLSEAGEAQ